MKKIFLTVLFAGLSYQAVAQLFVRPNPTTNTDSYVYVSDAFLYVENDINLELNTNTTDTVASIYLRRDGQLLQGNTAAAANQGDGLLSVYQQGFADRYEYNYWTSPVGNASASIGNESFGITRIFDVVNVTESTQALNIEGFNGVSSPLTISRRWIWKYITGTTYGEWIFVGNTTTLAPGQGFTMKGVDVGADLASTPRQEYDFRGKPNSGNITNSVADDELTLIGNPYPSAVDLVDFFAGNPDVDATAFYWEQDHTTNSHFLQDYQGGYATWTDDGTLDGEYLPALFLSYGGDGSAGPPTGGGTPLIQRRYAPIGQGFMVRGDVDGSVTMRNEYREYVPEGALNFSEFKSAGFGNSTAMDSNDENASEDADRLKERPRIRINAFINNDYASQIALLFYDKATIGEDRGMDAKSPRDIPNDIYWSLIEDPEDEEYIIQTVPYSEELMLPLTFKVAETSDFRLYIEERSEFSQDMYLYDALEDTYQLLSKEEYTLQQLDAGLYTNRFYITFRELVNPSTEATAKFGTQVNVFQNNPAKQLEILNNEQLDLDTASLFDVSGKLIWTKTNLGTQSSYTYGTGILADGVYVLQIQAKDGAVTTQKVIVSNK